MTDRVTNLSRGQGRTLSSQGFFRQNPFTLSLPGGLSGTPGSPVLRTTTRLLTLTAFSPRARANSMARPSSPAQRAGDGNMGADGNGVKAQGKG